MKRGISLLMTFITLVTMCAGININVFAATSGDFTYSVLSNGNVQITKYNGTSKVVYIPSSISGRDVVAIGSSTFLSSTTVTKVSIPNTVKTIAEGTFRVACIANVQVDVTSEYFASTNGALYNKDKTVLITCPYANTDCMLGLSDATIVISENAFWNCTKLTSITIPENVESIGPYAFYKCINLSTINFADKTTSIGRNAFMNTAWLESQSDGIVYANKIAYGYKGQSPQSLTFAEGIVGIADYAFKDCIFLKNISIPSSVVNVGNYSFMSCSSLESIELNDGLKTIGENCFRSCNFIDEINVPSTVSSIGNGAFSECLNLSSVNIENNNYFVNCDGVIFDTSMKRLLCYPVLKSGDEYVIPSTVTTLDNYAFANCNSLTSVTVPTSVKTLYENTFSCMSGEFKIYCSFTSPVRTFAASKNIPCYCCNNQNIVTTITRATTSSNGKSVNACTNCKQIKSTTAINKIGSVSLSTTSYVYNGDIKKPSVTVKNSSGTTLKKGTDYTVSYKNSSSKSVGKYSVVVNFIGNYSGSKTLYYKIYPPQASIKSVTAKGKAFVVKWNKKSGITGYQVQYSSKSNFSSKKTYTISKSSTVSKTVKSLKSGKKYYVRVRTYKKVGSTTYYGSWSTKKSIITK